MLVASRVAAAERPSPKSKEASMSDVRYRTQKVGPVDVFYREAGAADAPVILLLHGFPTSGHMFRDLIPALAHRYRVIAPDVPGFGQTKAPPRGEFEYGFDNLATVLGDFVDALGLSRYALYIFDYGAPVGLRLAMRHPDRVAAIVTQNGNAYVEGFSKEWGPWETYWREPTPAHREATRASLTDEAIRFQHEHGAPAGSVAPDGCLLDTLYMNRPGAREIQLDLILSYRTNVALYPAFQAYFRKHHPPVLAVWGRNDAFFIPPGRAGVPSRQSRRRDPPSGCGTLRAGDAPPGDLRADPRIPRSPCVLAMTRESGSSGLSSYGLTMAQVTSSRYRVPQRPSRETHEHHPEIDGILYSSRFDGGECIAIFDWAADAITKIAVTGRSLTPELATEFAVAFGKTYVEP